MLFETDVIKLIRYFTFCKDFERCLMRNMARRIGDSSGKNAKIFYTLAYSSDEKYGRYSDASISEKALSYLQEY